jgi:hypothetical protein
MRRARDPIAESSNATKMSHARPEFAIVAAVIGILLAIGVPALQRGERVEGWICIGLAALVAGWVLATLIRLRK